MLKPKARDKVRTRGRN
ncbi:hypothetical protein IEO21_11196 [Rhodonia placenta]|uniref:Uncharacterized protein n=1 Tax=Rhodonia placenta TaxID=104341 RepID=A0A8H7TWP3_9APHY|nr:hypothetical protein IEO21_11196 [Postia placenta]